MQWIVRKGHRSFAANMWSRPNLRLIPPGLQLQGGLCPPTPHPPPHTPHTPHPSESCRGSSHQEGHVSGSLHRTVSKDAGYRHVPWGLRSAEFYRSSNFTAVQVFRTPSQHAPLQVCWARALSLVIPLPHFQKKTSHKHKKIAQPKCFFVLVAVNLVYWF